MPIFGAKSVQIRFVKDDSGIKIPAPLILLSLLAASCCISAGGSDAFASTNSNSNGAAGGSPTSTEPRVLVSIGKLENLGINDRYPYFRTALLTSLERAFQGTRFALLRTNLDGAGTGDSSQSPRPVVLVANGIYQTFREGNPKIELTLRVREIGGSQRFYSLKESPGRELNEKIASVLTGAVSELQSIPSPPRKTEALTQLARGKQRARMREGAEPTDFGGYLLRQPAQEEKLQVSNASEAIEAFESALLLNPDCAEAKVCLAMCLVAVGKVDSARDHLSEVIAGCTNVAMVVAARRQLALSHTSLEDKSPIENDLHALDLLLALDRDATQPDDHLWILGHALRSVCRLKQAGRLGSDVALELYDNWYRASCMSADNATANTGDLFWAGSALQQFKEFDRYFDFDQELTEAHLNYLLPQVAQSHPRLATYLWSSYALWHREVEPSARTNFVNRLMESLKICRNNPESIKLPGSFYTGYFYRLLEWAVSHEEFQVGEILGEIRQEDITRHKPSDEYLQAFWSMPTNELAKTHCYVGYCNRALGNWKKAVAAFAEAQKMMDTLVMEREGPWGAINTRIRAQALLDECNGHLAPQTASVTPDTLTNAPVTFTLGEPVLKLGRFIAFACDGDRVWLTDGTVPFVYNTTDQSLTDLVLPTKTDQGISCIQADSKNLWWGTRGGGVVQMDKQTRQCKVYNEKNGLPSGQITSLALSADKLWIGFGLTNASNVGYLDLKTYQFVGLPTEPEAPRGFVEALTPTPNGDLWLLSASGLRYLSLSQTHWSVSSNRFLSGWRCLAANTNYVAIGGNSAAGGLIIHDVANRQVKEVDLRAVLKPGSACTSQPCTFDIYSLAATSEHLWAGGGGFILLVDLKSGRVEKICDFDDRRENNVQQLETDGDSLWVAIRNKLYRLPLAGVNVVQGSRETLGLPR